MPELPEVHTTTTELGKLVTGRQITDVWSAYDSPHYYGKEQIKDPVYFKKFKKEIIGKTITSTSRVGKNVLIHLESDLTILVHMKMTGHLLYGKYVFEIPVLRPESYKDKRSETQTPRTSEARSGVQKQWIATEPGPLRDDKWNGWIRLVFTLDNKKHIALSDLRKFAKVTLLKTSELKNSEDLKDIGPDPLERGFSFKTFKERLLQTPKGKIKTVLMNQKAVAGIGNIYSDEALWLAYIHPETEVGKIKEEKLQNLFVSVKQILRKGINLKGDSTSDYRTPTGEAGQFQGKHQVYQQTKNGCKRKGCEGIIQRKVIGGRSAHFCSVCQTK